MWAPMSADLSSRRLSWLYCSCFCSMLLWKALDIAFLRCWSVHWWRKCSKVLKCGIYRYEVLFHGDDCAPWKFGGSVSSTYLCDKEALFDKEWLELKSCINPILSCRTSFDCELGCIGVHKFQRICGRSEGSEDYNSTVRAEYRCGSTVVRVVWRLTIGELREVLICNKKYNNQPLCCYA